MNENQASDSAGSLFDLQNVRETGDVQEFEERVHRAEADRSRAERRALAAAIRWDRERERLQAQIAELTTHIGRLRELGDDNEALEKRNNELEEQIVELLSRTGNDHRRTQAAEERANAELEVHKRKLEIEHQQKLRVAEVHLKKEVRTLEKEIERLRREVVRRTPSLFQRLRAREN
jgi:chromosome segregation ATPase